MKISFLVFFLFSLISVSISQTNFQPGYIITNSQDTIFGTIDNRNVTRNMKVCNFIKNGQNEVEEFVPEQIHGYRFTENGKFYVSKYLNLDEVQDTVFVEYLLDGITDLYYYQNQSFVAYLLENEEGEIFELTNEEVEVTRDGQVYMVEKKRYLGTLSYAFSDFPNLAQEIGNTQLTHKSLINITRKYHDYACEDEQCVIYEKTVPLLRVQVMPIVGFSASTINNKEPELSKIYFDPSFSPCLGVGLNWIFPLINEKISLKTDFILRKDNYSSSYQFTAPNQVEVFRDIHFHSTNMALDIALKYTYPKGKVTPSLFAGGKGIIEVDNHFTLSQETWFNSDVTNSTYDMEPIYSINGQRGLILGAGVEFLAWKGFHLFSDLSYSRVWNGSAGYFKFQRNWATFALGCVF